MTNITVPLQVPITNGEQTINELTFHEAEVGYMIDASGAANEFERLAMMMAFCSNTPLAVFRKVKARDLKNIMSKVGNLVGNETKKPTGSE